MLLLVFLVAVFSWYFFCIHSILNYSLHNTRHTAAICHCVQLPTVVAGQRVFVVLATLTTDYGAYPSNVEEFLRVLAKSASG